MTSEQPFRVIPAVDILGEEAVRLVRGDFAEVALREADPFALVERFAATGAGLVHVVDLSAARSGVVRPEVVRRAAEAAAPAAVQAAGGIRSIADAEALVEAGAAHVVAGTVAFSKGSILDRLVARLGERLIVAVDVRDGTVAIDGWTRATALTVSDALTRCAEAGVPRVMCTAIERDGTLTGPSLDLLAEVAASGIPTLAAGGIRSVGDLAAVEATGCEGAIVGRALLEGLVPLAALGSGRLPVESPA